MKTETRKGKGGGIEKKCVKCGEWKPETEKHYYRTKKTGKFRDECKVCTAPFQKYRVESQKGKKAKNKPGKKQNQAEHNSNDIWIGVTIFHGFTPFEAFEKRPEPPQNKFYLTVLLTNFLFLKFSCSF